MAELRGDPRERIDRLIDAGHSGAARAQLKSYFRANMRPAVASFVLSRLGRIHQTPPLVGCKLTVLRSFTVEPAILLLRASAAISGIDLAVHVGDFNAYAQEILDAASALYQRSPDVVILAVQSRDIAPDLWYDFARMSRPQVAEAMERVTAAYRNWVKALRSRLACSMIIHSFEVPFRGNNGILDWQRGDGQTGVFCEINRQLHELPLEFPGVFVLDYNGLIGARGRDVWHNESAWITVRLPISADCLSTLASEWLRFLHPLTGKVCKAVAVDLDNTLWGGVVGEDGFHGIELGGDDPGVAYLNLQRALLDLHSRGVLLAICSKNNPAEALEVLEKHPDMLLRPSHFSAQRINWRDKVHNLREIAEDLNIGIDSMAFLDDNPAEREWVESQLPEVTVIDLPADPLSYERALRECPVFERLTISIEDSERGRYYDEQRLREGFKLKAESLEDYYRALEMRVAITAVNSRTLTRVAQLTQKTNQFNVTTRRYTETQIEELAAQPDCYVDAVRVLDRFGDNGIVGVMITRAGEIVHEIDTLLLSCRVIGRTVESAMLSFLALRAREQGASWLRGEFLESKKNAPARDLYPSHGFRYIDEAAAGPYWELDLMAGGIDSPSWLRVEFSEEIRQ
jgi:FkbH-like protein